MWKTSSARHLFYLIRFFFLGRARSFSGFCWNWLSRGWKKVGWPTLNVDGEKNVIKWFEKEVKVISMENFIYIIFSRRLSFFDQPFFPPWETRKYPSRTRKQINFLFAFHFENYFMLSWLELEIIIPQLSTNDKRKFFDNVVLKKFKFKF